MSYRRQFHAYFFVMALFAIPVQVVAEIEPEADKWLKTMSDYLGQLNTFSLHLENTLDHMLSPSRKIQFAESTDVAVKRPNQAQAKVKGDIRNGQFFYDGKTLTLHSSQQNIYAQVKAPNTLDQTMDKMIEEYDLFMPLSDLINSNPYDALIQENMTGLYLGIHQVNGTPCHHLFFSGEEVDWQIWIDAGDKPLPRKYLITSKWQMGTPQFTSVLSNWKTQISLPDESFIFQPPEKSVEIDLLPADVDW